MSLKNHVRQESIASIIDGIIQSATAPTVSDLQLILQRALQYALIISSAQPGLSANGTYVALHPTVSHSTVSMTYGEVHSHASTYCHHVLSKSTLMPWSVNPA